jgi:hypothetical protein
MGYGILHRRIAGYRRLGYRMHVIHGLDEVTESNDMTTLMRCRTH